MKKIDKSAHTGDGAIALIHQRVYEMGFVWHERKTDAGIDGEIELRNAVTGEVANRALLVQSKGKGERRFPGENDDGFHFLCSAADVTYWMSAPVPVLLVCSHPETGEAWWMYVQGWFADPEHLATGRIDFDKNTQKFDRSAAQRLLALADPHGDAHVPVAEDRPETLTSNLLPVAIPATLYHASINTQDPREVLSRQRTEHASLPFAEDFILRGGQLYSWRHPERSALGKLITGPVKQMPVAQWADSGDETRQRWLVQLLNNALRSDVSADCAWHGGRKIIFWRPTRDFSARSIRSASGRTRQVFTPKYKKNNPTQVSYYLHAALEWQFLDIDGAWYCALVPTYHYTRDGHRTSLLLSEYLAGIKRLDRNPAVYHQTRMWAYYLHGHDEALAFRDNILTYGTLETFDAGKGIDDKAWRADSRKPADDADPEPLTEVREDGLALFEVPR
ncbi:DUF4365 domain-containing protein [Actinoplanes auranticolor]|uniref:DUF4365 domain-containing protein n=1 Tax=Actinoplanes auranticolor TaxID=47988 RepID=A0A919S499_9ACTN|nr:DUF4365 domain-containing protein [Actinoplanes auranticolor]GIM64591.1 hypothetical protein Aau02nite_11420 [Actinoplanes auranticolor]